MLPGRGWEKDLHRSVVGTKSCIRWELNMTVEQVKFLSCRVSWPGDYCQLRILVHLRDSGRRLNFNFVA